MCFLQLSGQLYWSLVSAFAVFCGVQKLLLSDDVLQFKWFPYILQTVSFLRLTWSCLWVIFSVFVLSGFVHVRIYCQHWKLLVFWILLWASFGAFVDDVPMHPLDGSVFIEMFAKRMSFSLLIWSINAFSRQSSDLSFMNSLWCFDLLFFSEEFLGFRYFVLSFFLFASWCLAYHLCELSNLHQLIKFWFFKG